MITTTSSITMSSNQKTINSGAGQQQQPCSIVTMVTNNNNDGFSDDDDNDFPVTIEDRIDEDPNNNNLDPKDHNLIQCSNPNNNVSIDNNTNNNNNTEEEEEEDDDDELDQEYPSPSSSVMNMMTNSDLSPNDGSNSNSSHILLVHGHRASSPMMSNGHLHNNSNNYQHSESPSASVISQHSSSSTNSMNSGQQPRQLQQLQQSQQPQQSTMNVHSTAEYLQQLLKDRTRLTAFPGTFIHAERLIDAEIARIRASLFQINGGEKKLLILPEPDGPVINKTEKVYVPVDEHPDFNFVGRILGPRGMTAKQLEQETGCKIMIRGRGSMRDKKKEEQNRGKPNWEHLGDKLHVLVTVEDTENRANLKLHRAIEEIKKLLVPITEGEDELKKRQLMELAIINGTYRDSGQRNVSATPTAVTTTTGTPHLTLGLDPGQLNTFAAAANGGIPMAALAAAAAAASNGLGNGNGGNGGGGGAGGGGVTTLRHHNPQLAAVAAAAAAAHHHHHFNGGHHHPHAHPHHLSHHQTSPLGASLLMGASARQFAHHHHHHTHHQNAASAVSAIPPPLIAAASSDGTLLYAANPAAVSASPFAAAVAAAEFHHQYAAATTLGSTSLLDFAAAAASGTPVIDASTATSVGKDNKKRGAIGPMIAANRSVNLIGPSPSSSTAVTTLSSHRYHPYDHRHLIRATTGI